MKFVLRYTQEVETVVEADSLEELETLLDDLGHYEAVDQLGYDTEWERELYSVPDGYGPVETVLRDGRLLDAEDPHQGGGGQ